SLLRDIRTALNEACRREDFQFEYIRADTNSYDDIYKAVSSTFFVGCLDGSQGDALIHYVSGAMLPRPYAGTGSLTLPRDIVLIQAIPVRSPLVADSLRRRSKNVKILEPGSVLEAFNVYVQEYRAWRRRPANTRHANP